MAKLCLFSWNFCFCSVSLWDSCMINCLSYVPVVIKISETLELGGICLCLPSAYKWRVRTMVVLSTLEWQGLWLHGVTILMQEDAVGMVKSIVGSMVCVYNNCHRIVCLKTISSLGCETSYMLLRELVTALGLRVTMFCPHTVFFTCAPAWWEFGLMVVQPQPATEPLLAQPTSVHPSAHEFISDTRKVRKKSSEARPMWALSMAVIYRLWGLKSISVPSPLSSSKLVIASAMRVYPVNPHTATCCCPALVCGVVYNTLSLSVQFLNYIYLWVHMHRGTHIEVREKESVLSFHHVGPKDRIWVVSFDSKSHLAGCRNSNLERHGQGWCDVGI